MMFFVCQLGSYLMLVFKIRGLSKSASTCLILDGMLSKTTSEREILIFHLSNMWKFSISREQSTGGVVTLIGG